MTGAAQASNATTRGFDPRGFPSCVGIDILISDQIGEYSTRDLQKIAMDIKAGVPHADEAFHFVYSRMMGWE
jgi:hypothetical protein